MVRRNKLGRVLFIGGAEAGIESSPEAPEAVHDDERRQ